jgi:Kef-type K+ transport system membrane component KefB
VSGDEADPAESHTDDEDYNRDDESEAERLDRNYNELLQELRVAQTGVQILFAFLLGIAFQQRFQGINDYQRDIYLVTLTSSACAATLLIAPVAVHRMLFRRHLKNELVVITARLAASGLVFLAIAILAALLFVVDAVSNLTTALIITGAVAILLVIVWYSVPRAFRKHHPMRELSPDR